MMDGSTMPDAATLHRQRRRVLISSYVGSVIEWLDFYLYTIAAASVFSVLFFPSRDPAISMIGSLSTLAVAYVVRPLGGIVYGYFGDRLGRKRMLVSSILLMGISTVLVGCLPTYEQIGIMAPILLVLLRVLQGIAVAGEWGGAVLMALEHAAPRRRGLWSCFTGMGISTGLLLASGCFALLARMPQDQFLSWGWRVPFLLASLLIGVGLWVRLGIEESPVFLADQARIAGSRQPGAPATPGLRRQWNQVLLAFFLVMGPFAISGLKTGFLVAYAISAGFPRDVTLAATTVSSVASILCMLIGGWASDVFGRRPVVIAGGVGLSVVGFFLFDIIDQKSAVMLMVAMCLVTGMHGIMYGPLGAFISELFPTRTRYTGASLSYQLAGVVGGGFGPAIAATLLALAGGYPHAQYVVVFMVLCPIIAIIAAWMAPETAWNDLKEAGPVNFRRSGRGKADDSSALPTAGRDAD